MPFAKLTAIGGVTVDLSASARFVNQLELLLNKYASDASELLLEPTRTWENHTVTFSREFKRDGVSISHIIYTTSDIYFYLNSGTSVRRAVLSKDWRSKTVPRELKSGAGAGRVVVVGKKIERPGIKAREWTSVVSDQLRPQFEKDMGELAVEAFGGKR